MLYYQNGKFRTDYSLEYYSHSRLKNIDFEEGVTSICSYAYYGMNGESVLERAILPNSLESIGAYAFSYNNSLKSVLLKGNCSNVGDYVFQYCNNLTVTVSRNSLLINYFKINGIRYAFGGPLNAKIYSS